MCLQGAARVAAALHDPPVSAGLRLFVAWVPMLPTDNKASAVASAGDFPNEVAHYWDRGRYLSARMGAALGISDRESVPATGGAGFAWDVYLAYLPAGTNLLRPDFWMHQLALAHAPKLDAVRFRREIAHWEAPTGR